MICTNCFINKFQMGKLMSSCLCTRINLMCILCNNEHSSRIHCKAVSKIDINLQSYSQTYPTDTNCNKTHYTHIQQYNCYKNTYWNKSNKVHNICYKSQSHQNSIGWDMFVRIGHCINTIPSHCSTAHNWDNMLSCYHTMNMDIDSFDMWSWYGYRTLMWDSLIGTKMN